ncbi:hypothetical protein B0H13DRAFT_1911817 [Mycena leptocephala]|nr:hypothetical protein B0H13DRAFT_1911817 [Mycena leptocephala]
MSANDMCRAIVLFMPAWLPRRFFSSPTPSSMPSHISGADSEEDEVPDLISEEDFIALTIPELQQGERLDWEMFRVMLSKVDWSAAIDPEYSASCMENIKSTTAIQGDVKQEP